MFSSIESIIEWLNQKPAKEREEAVRYTLQRQYFKSKIDRKRILGEQELI